MGVTDVPMKMSRTYNEIAENVELEKRRDNVSKVAERSQFLYSSILLNDFLNNIVPA